MASRRSKVLIVDDEDNIVLALHRVLYQDNHRYDVLLARSAEIAQQILLDIPIDVLVTDVHLPEKSGMDLLCWAAVESPLTRVIVMTAFDVTGIKDKAHAFGCLRLMRKPFDVHEMRSTILRALDRRDSFTGNLADLSAIDVIQMLCIGRKTTALRLSEGPSSGVVLIENGEIVHAIWDNQVGEEAFFKMMAVKNGLFYTSPLPPDIERTIKGDWQYLLIEGLRKLDEAAHAAETGEEDQPNPSVKFSPFALKDEESSSGSSDAVAPPPESEAAPSLDAHRVARLIDDGFAALRAGKRDDARQLWQEALRLDPTNRMIELNLRKLEAKNLHDRR